MNTASRKGLFDRCALGLFFSFIGAACLLAIKFHSSRSLTNPNDPGPWLLPILLGAVLLLGGVAFIVVNITKLRTETVTHIDPGDKFNWQPWTLLGGIVLYVALLPWLGFLLTTPVFVSLMLWRMKIIWWKALIAGVVLTATGQFVFVQGLMTPLPTGFWN